MTSSAEDPSRATVLSYDRAAPIYALQSSDRSGLRRLHARLRDLLSDGALVLDLGCGPGHDSAALSDLGLNLQGLDPARGLLAEARDRRNLPGTAIQGDARWLPFRSASFDAIWSCASLLHVPASEVHLALSEVIRVLKPGGILFTSMSEGPDAAPVLYDPGMELPLRTYYYYPQQRWRALVTSAGFEIIDHALGSANPNPGSGGWIETFARKP